MREGAQLTVMTFALKEVPTHRSGVTGGNRREPVNHRLEDPVDLRWPKRHDHVLFLDVPEAAGSSVSAASLKEMPTHISHAVVSAMLHRSELQLKRRIDLLEAVHIRTGTVLEIALISQRAAAHLPVPADVPPKWRGSDTWQHSQRSGCHAEGNWHRRGTRRQFQANSRSLVTETALVAIGTLPLKKMSANRSLHHRQPQL
jgi:hypothetical protein